MCSYISPILTCGTELLRATELSHKQQGNEYWGLDQEVHEELHAERQKLIKIVHFNQCWSHLPGPG